MPSNKNKNKSKKQFPRFTCEHNPYVIVHMRNCEDPADTKIILALHTIATEDPIITSEVISSLLRFEKTHNKGEFPYNIVVECSDAQVAVSKEGQKNFTVRETMDWLVPFITSDK